MFLARYIASEVTFREPCLLRVGETDIRYTNWHLYYHLRQSYGNHMLIDEAPGHLFLDYETEDLATFLYVAMLFGWDAELEPYFHYVKGRLSHDGVLDLYSAQPEILEDFQKAIERMTLTTILRP